MKTKRPPKPRSVRPASLTTELLILPDGNLLVHNLTRTMAALLHGLDPANAAIRLRAQVRPAASRKK